jgi:short-subunit dehydrogenase
MDDKMTTIGIFGAGRGLGAATAKRFGRGSFDVALIPRQEFLRHVLATTADDPAAAVAFSILGPAAAVQQVLGGMRELGPGTILFVNGPSAVSPNERVAGTSTAFAGESAYASMLHTALQSEGIQVRQLIIPGAIGGGDPAFAPDALADQLWELHAQPGVFRKTVGQS